MGKKGKSAIESQIRMLELSRRIVDKVFKAYPSLKEVYIFGSRASGSYLDTSDLDLLFVFEGIKDVPVIQRMYMVSKFVEGNVDYIVVDESEKDNIKVKKLLWERERFY